jgi:hypothetical protein
MVLFGGTGIVLYAIGWLVLPVDDGTPSVGQQALDRGRHRPTSQTWLAVVLTIAVALGVFGAFGHWDGPVLLSLAVIGVLVWLVRRSSGNAPGAAAPAAPAATAPTAPTAAAAGAPVPPPAAPFTATAPTYTAPGEPMPQATTEPTVAMPAPPTAPGSTTPPEPPQPPAEPPRWQAPPPPPVPVPPVPPRPPKPRSHLFGFTFSLALVALGVLAALDVGGYDPPSGAYPALALAVTAFGLLVGTWFGRARGLIFYGIVLSVVTVGATIASDAQHLSDRAVDDHVTITQVDQLPTADRYGAGQVQYDLTGLDLAGQSVKMRSQMGFGEIVVVVPEDVDVTVHARAGVGGLSLFGTDTGGVNERITRTDDGPDGPGGGSLDLDLYAGFGHLEVRRAAA